MKPSSASCHTSLSCLLIIAIYSGSIASRSTCFPVSQSAYSCGIIPLLFEFDHFSAIALSNLSKFTSLFVVTLLSSFAITSVISPYCGKPFFTGIRILGSCFDITYPFPPCLANCAFVIPSPFAIIPFNDTVLLKQNQKHN